MNINLIKVTLSSYSVCTDDRFNLLEKDTCMYIFSSKGRVLLWGNFNTGLGKGNNVDDFIVMFEKASCNSNGSLIPRPSDGRPGTHFRACSLIYTTSV